MTAFVVLSPGVQLGMQCISAAKLPFFASDPLRALATRLTSLPQAAPAGRARAPSATGANRAGEAPPAA
jgi:hypothetical protein